MVRVFPAHNRLVVCSGNGEEKLAPRFKLTGVYRVVRRVNHCFMVDNIVDRLFQPRAAEFSARRALGEPSYFKQFEKLLCPGVVRGCVDLVQHSRLELASCLLALATRVN